VSKFAYDIALRPYRDNVETDGTSLLDDIVVNDVTCFRAEDMTGKAFWAACYFANGERLCFWVTAKSRPLRIEWIATEWPEGDFTYEPGSVVS
jgi:hypothetical protein